MKKRRLLRRVLRKRARGRQGEKGSGIPRGVGLRENSPLRRGPGQFSLSPTDLCIIHLSLPASRTPFSGQVVKKSTGTWLHKEWRNINGLPLGNSERWKRLLFFILRSQYTAKEPEESRRGTGADEQKGSFSEVRRKLSRKTGKKGGEIWPPSQISSGHGGEVLQEFSVVCTIRPFFLSFCFTSCHRGNKNPFVRLPPSPSCSPQALWRSILPPTILSESASIRRLLS